LPYFEVTKNINPISDSKEGSNIHCLIASSWIRIGESLSFLEKNYSKQQTMSRTFLAIKKTLNAETVVGGPCVSREFEHSGETETLV